MSHSSRTTDPRLPPSARCLLASAVSLALGSAAASAHAAGTEQSTEEIVVRGRSYDHEVSSQKFTAPLLDTPKSVTIVPAELLEQQGATSLVEALRNVPGITFNAGEGGQPAGDNLKIRGFDAGADVFIDGVRDAGSQTRDIFALEQIEVVKGPASAYSGRGSAGGTINLVTKKPRDESFTSARLGAGTDSYARAALDTNFRFGDSAAFRLNVMRQDADVPGRDSVFVSHTGLAPSVTFGVGEPSRVTVDYYYYRTDDVPDYSFPYGRSADNSAAAGTPVVIDRNNFYGLLTRDFQKTGADIVTVAFEHDLHNGFTLRNTTRSGTSSNDYIVTNPDDSRGNVPNGYVLRNSKSRNSETTTRANLTDIAGNVMVGRLPHSFAAGIELSHEEMYNRNYSIEGTYTGNALTDFAASCSAPDAVGAASHYNCTTLANPAPNDPWSGAIAPSPNATFAETETRSLYAFDTIGLSERWLLNVGLRHDDYDTFQRSGAIDAPTEVENAADFWNYQAGVSFKPRPNGSIYLATGTSSSPSGNTLGDGTENLGTNNADLEPERNRNYEIGSKWLLRDGRLSLTSALFTTERNNARVAIEPGRGAPQQTIGEQRLRGLELGTSGRIGDAWSLTASYTLLESEIVDDGPIGGDEGNDFPNTPRHSATFWASYEVLPDFTIGAGATYVDRRYGNTANTVWVPSYVTYDAMASFKVGDKARVQLNLQNLTDEVYFVRPYATHYAAIGPARSVVLTMNVDF